MGQGALQIAIFLAIVVAVAPFFGAYMARVFSDERVFLTPVLAPVERGLHRSTPPCASRGSRTRR